MSKSSSKEKRGSKSSAIRAVLDSFPTLGNKAVAEILSKKGVHCKSQDVANQRARLKKLGAADGKTSFSLDDLKRVKATVDQAGGLKQVQSLVQSVDELANQAGGMEKLRRGLHELPELMGS